MTSSAGLSSSALISVRLVQLRSVSRPSRTEACWIESTLVVSPAAAEFTKRSAFTDIATSVGQDVDDVVERGVGVVDAGEELEQRQPVGGHGSGRHDRGPGEEVALEVVRSRELRCMVVVQVLDAFDDDEPAGGMVDVDPFAQRVAVRELEVVLDDAGEVEQRFELGAVREIVERDPKALFDQTGEPVAHGLSRFDVLEDFQHDTVGRNRCEELGLGDVVGGEVDERSCPADKGVQPDLGDRVHQHACRRDVTVDELGGRRPRRRHGTATRSRSCPTPDPRSVGDRRTARPVRQREMVWSWEASSPISESGRSAKPTYRDVFGDGNGPRVFADGSPGMPEGSTNGKDPQWPS